MKNYFTLIILLLFQLSLFAQTSVSGNQSGTWTSANSPYLVTGEIIIPAGQTLTIEPGVEVNFQGHFKLAVDGTLIAAGTETDSIFFTTDNVAVGWSGIRLTESQTGSALAYCGIKYGKTSLGDFPDQHGGGVMMNNCDATIDHCLFYSNEAQASDHGMGGAIYGLNTTAATQITNCDFIDNDAYAEGGAIKLSGDTGAAIDNCAFLNNAVLYGGGGVCLYGCYNTNISNSLFAGNVTSYASGGGVYVEGYSAGIVFANCTITENEAAGGDGGGVDIVYSDASFTNTIIYNNPGAYSDDLYLEFSSAEVNYCNLTMPDDATGANNIDADPKFTDAANGDYSLRYDSPCIDAGTGDYVYDENANHDFGWRLDMGAIEYSGDRVLKTVAGTGEILFGGKVRAKINVTDAGSLSQIDITVHENEWHPEAWPDETVKRWFNINPTGSGFNCDLTLSYKDSELDGIIEELLLVYRWNGSEWNGIFPAYPQNIDENWLTIQGVDEFGDFTFIEDGFPVELNSFTANVINETVQLKWQTGSEINNKGFSVERKSLSAQDANEWNEIGFVDGAGTTAEPHQYSFTDDNVSNGKYFYRLKQIDIGGTFEYSESIEVEVGAPGKFELSQNFPNPFGKTSRSKSSTTKIEYSLPEQSA
ncbi:MAG: hypothetical protein GXO87_08450, partial [Chlorobi bacterium]|nr:hypothetical protein [Chlorobiota bacterium]